MPDAPTDFEPPFILAIDQGTTSSRAMVFDVAGRVVSVSQREFKQHYPAEGRIEHDPEEIWQTTREVARRAFEKAEDQGGEVVAIGITNQRETTIIWDRETGEPIYNAIVWQDRRTSATCRKLREAGFETEVASRTGLVIDPYFSATKAAWILDKVEGARERADKG